MFKFAGKSADRSSIPIAKPGREPEAGAAGRRDLLERISDFLLHNTLEVNPRNLVLAHGVFSGSNMRLSRQIIQRQIANQPITQAWLNEISGEDAETGDSGEALKRLIGTLDQSLQKFSRNATEASSSTASYRAALTETAESLEAIGPAPNEIAALTHLTRTMIERTGVMEAEMLRREREAVGLRKSLDLARHDAEVDHLTGLSNRRAFEVVLDQEYRAAREAIEPLSIAFCDIDKFKLINDTHGHDTGDRVIQAIARVLQRISDQNCHVARHGGEEFVLLFRGITTEEAREKLDDAREAFARRKLVDRQTDAPIGNVTFSGGIADVFAFGDPRAALKAADEALYQAKEQGRNRILVAIRTDN